MLVAYPDTNLGMAVVLCLELYAEGFEKLRRGVSDARQKVLRAQSLVVLDPVGSHLIGILQLSFEFRSQFGIILAGKV